jgi:hypothetical protein
MYCTPLQAKSNDVLLWGSYPRITSSDRLPLFNNPHCRVRPNSDTKELQPVKMLRINGVFAPSPALSPRNSQSRQFRGKSGESPPPHPTSAAYESKSGISSQ